MPDFAMYVGVSAGDLREACDRGIVCRDSSGWYFEGRAGVRSRPEERREENRLTISGEVETGVYARGGGYVGAAGAAMAIVSQAGRLVIFIASTHFDDVSTFETIVRRTQ